MKQFIFETYYTCTFKTVHTLNNLNDQELAKIHSRNDEEIEVIDVKLNKRNTKKIGDSKKSSTKLKKPSVFSTTYFVLAFKFILIQMYPGKNIFSFILFLLLRTSTTFSYGIKISSTSFEIEFSSRSLNILDSIFFSFPEITLRAY